MLTDLDDWANSHVYAQVQTHTHKSTNARNNSQSEDQVNPNTPERLTINTIMSGTAECTVGSTFASIKTHFGHAHRWYYERGGERDPIRDPPPGQSPAFTSLIFEL